MPCAVHELEAAGPAGEGGLDPNLLMLEASRPSMTEPRYKVRRIIVFV